MTRSEFIAMAKVDFVEMMVSYGETISLTTTQNTVNYNAVSGKPSVTGTEQVVHATGLGMYQPSSSLEQARPSDLDDTGLVLIRGKVYLSQELVDSQDAPVTDIDALYQELKYKVTVGDEILTPVMKPKDMDNMGVYWLIEVGDKV